MADPKPKLGCTKRQFPHPYDAEGEEGCTLDAVCHAWESGRKETKMDERDAFRRKLHANPDKAALIAELYDF